MKAESIQLDVNPSLTIKLNSNTNTYSYGKFNSYPQVIESAIKSSPSAKAVQTITSRFLAGNPDKFVDLVYLIARDVTTYNGFAIWVGYDGKGDISEIRHIPFSWCRISREDDNENYAYVRVSENWNDKKVRIKTYFKFNPLKEVLAVQMQGNFNGQVYYVNMDDNGLIYPESPFDAVVKDMISDSEISTFRYKTLKNGFLNTNFIRTKPFVNDNERDEFVNMIKTSQGSENASSIIIVEDENIQGDGKSGFDVFPVSSNLNDKLFESWISSIKNNIKRVYNVPDILFDSTGGLSNVSGNTIAESVRFFNFQTAIIRQRMILELNRVLSASKFGVVTIKQNNYEFVG